MYKALRVIALMVLVGYMSAGLIKLPKQICKPAKKIGYLIANGVTKCAAKYGLPTRRLQAAPKCNFESAKTGHRCGASFGGMICTKGRYCSSANYCGYQAEYKNSQQPKYSNAFGCSAAPAKKEAKKPAKPSKPAPAKPSKPAPKKPAAKPGKPAPKKPKLPSKKRPTGRKGGKRTGKRGGKRGKRSGKRGKRSGKRGKRSGKRGKRGGKKAAGKAKLKVKVKITSKAKKSLADKIVKKLLDFIGCSRRRLSIDYIKQEARILEDTKKAKKCGKKCQAWKAVKAKIGGANRKLSSGYAKLESQLRNLVNTNDVKRRMQIVSEVESHLRNLESDIQMQITSNHRRLTQDNNVRRAFQAVAHHVRENANKLDTKERRMGLFDWIKKGWNTIKKHVSKAFKHVKKFVKKHIGPAVKWVKNGIKKIGKKAMKWACGALKGICPKACNSVVKAVSPLIKGLGIPTKCDASAISICRKSCSILCEGI